MVVQCGQERALSPLGKGAADARLFGWLLKWVGGCFGGIFAMHSSRGKLICWEASLVDIQQVAPTPYSRIKLHSGNETPLARMAHTGLEF